MMEVSLFLTLIGLTFVVSYSDALVTFPENNSTLKCIPGKQFRYDHNICNCNDQGTKMICERKIFTTVTAELHRNQLQNVTMDCVPGKHFEHLCKDCICQESGKYATCVHSGCSSKETPKETRDSCIPGSIFNEICNGCICGPTGKGACTNLNCREYAFLTDNLKCVPNSLFMFKCNDCSCDTKGTSPSCEKVGCSPLTIPHEHILNITMGCDANSTFYYNCHRCICEPKEKYAICSGIPCPHRYEFVAVKDTPEKCNPGMVFASDCNVCVCGSDGKGVCTTFNCDISYYFQYKQDPILDLINKNF